MPKRIDGICQKCQDKKALYRCPKCSIIYCSVICFKNHKDSCIDAPASNQPTLVNTSKMVNLNKPAISVVLNEGDEKDYMSADTLKMLGTSEHLKGLLQNENLREMLHEVDCSKNKSIAMEKAMQISIFTEFVDECLKIVEPDTPTLWP